MLLQRLFLVTTLSLSLSACQTMSLLDGNRNFAELMDQYADLQVHYVGDGVDAINRSSAREALELEFAKNGDEAAQAGAKTDDGRAKASFYSLAARSYLKAGEGSSEKLIAAVAEGEAACNQLNDLERLPATCGVLQIATPMAVADITSFEIDAIRIKLRAGEADLTDGAVLVRAVQTLNEQSGKLTDVLATNVDARDAGAEFRRAILESQSTYFCNAQGAFTHLSQIDREGEYWTFTEGMSREDAFDAWTNTQLQPLLDHVRKTSGETARRPACDRGRSSAGAFGPSERG